MTTERDEPMTDATEDRDVFERALDAASEAFQAVLNEFDEERSPAELLRGSLRVRELHTDLVDAEFSCWLSQSADWHRGPEYDQ